MSTEMSTSDTHTEATAADAAKLAETPEANTEQVEAQTSSEDLETTETEGDEKDLGENDDKDVIKKDELKKKSGWQRTKEKLERKASLAEQEKEYWREQALKALKSPDAKDEPKQAAKIPEGKPNPDDFDSHEAWLDARDAWRDQQRELAQETKARESALRSEFQTKQDAHNKRLSEYKEKHADFNDLVEDFVEDVKDVRVPTSLEMAVVDSEYGPQLLHEFAKNRELFDRICSMDAMRIVREIGKLEARFENSSDSTKTTETKTTKAPKPISPISGGSSSAVKKSIFDKDLSFAEYERIRVQQQKEKGI